MRGTDIKLVEGVFLRLSSLEFLLIFYHKVYPTTPIDFPCLLSRKRHDGHLSLENFLD